MKDSSLTSTHARAAAAMCALMTLVCSACLPKAGLPDLSNLTDKDATARVHQAAARRLRMVGTLKARLPGVEGVILNATLDVAAELPARLSVAVRSFFEQPLQMLTTDGEVVTVFDATQGAPVFRRGPVDARALSLLLPIPLWPHEVVEVLLAHPPGDARGRLVAVDERRGTYDLWLEAPDRAPCLLTVRAQDDAVLRWRQFGGDGRPLVDVDYQDVRTVGDARVPFVWMLTLRDRQPEETLVLTATDVAFNGPPLGQEAFRIDPPQGVQLLPL